MCFLVFVVGLLIVRTDSHCNTEGPEAQRPIPEPTSLENQCISNMHQIMGNVQHNTGITNTPLRGHLEIH